MTNPIRAEEPDGLPPRERRAALTTIAIALAVSVLASVIANIALPSMARELHASPAESIWVVNAYQLAVTVALLPLAALGDIVGYRRIYNGGLVVFTLASLACGLADSLPVLVAARVLQGLGSAGIMSVNTALVRFIFPRASLGRGIGTIALVVATCSAAGPTIAAAILAVASWHWLFLVNIPFGMLAAWLALRSLPDTPKSGHAFDLTSAALNAATFGLLLIGLNGIGPGHAIWVAAELLGGTVAGVVFIRRQNRMTAPMLPVDLFRKPVFALSVATSVCSYSAQTIAFLALPFYFAIAGGMSQSRIGLLITPWPAVVVIVAPIAGRLSDRSAPAVLGAAGLGVMTLGMAALLTIPHGASFADIAWRMALCGLGFGFFQSPNNRLLLGAAPPERSGGASGMLSTARLLGQTTGSALVALSFGLAGTSGAGVAWGVRLALTVGTVASGIATAISLLRLGQMRGAR